MMFCKESVFVACGAMLFWANANAELPENVKFCIPKQYRVTYDCGEFGGTAPNGVQIGYGQMFTTPTNAACGGVHNRWRVDDSDTLITTNTTIPFSYVRDIKLTAAVDMTQDYVIDNGRLLWANPNLYLESSNGAAINTGYKPNFNTSIECRLMTFTSGSNGDPFGAKTAAYYNPNVIGFGIITRGKAISGFMLGNKQDDSVVRPLTTGQWYEMYLNANGLARVDSQEYNLGTPAALPDLPLSMFGCNNYGNQSSIDARFSYLKIMETDFVVLHMVPVPAGLRIGNYTVPSNGMWDMVEQKFYQNSGTGEFIYGRD